MKTTRNIMGFFFFALGRYFWGLYFAVPRCGAVRS